jgi:glycosyltransferase involved in cell wall biosynthesis
LSALTATTVANSTQAASTEFPAVKQAAVDAGWAIHRGGLDPDPAELDVTILMPCLNEAETLRNCVLQAREAIERSGVRGEVLIADNGSTDGSVEIARGCGARVIHVETRGYGSALLGGIEAARGKYILMGDADQSYDFGQIDHFLAKLREGYELVMGNRFRGGIAPGAMPFLHRYLGNPVLSWIGRLFFKCRCRDFHCGLRAFRRDSIRRLQLHTTGMEFASEMVVKSSLFNLKVTEVPATLSPDGRNRAPHLRTWRDGWRHLRFLLLFSPRWLFLYPGALLMLAGAAVGAWLLPGPQRVGRVTFDVHTLLYAVMAILVCFQCISFAAFTRVFAASVGLLPKNSQFVRRARAFTLERGLLFGLLLLAIGATTSVVSVLRWEAVNFGPLNPEQTLRWVIPSFLCCCLGLNITLSSFFLSILRMARQ